jgi:phospholipid/cholesterol/gamma-HCH transport system substrate-binding protein
METRANYVLVGSFVLLLMVGLLGFVMWLAKFQFDTKFSRYDIFFTDSVTGLRAGGAVRYSGVQVGEIVFIGLDKENPKRVRALIEVDATTPVKIDTVASMESQGLAGGRYILLSGGGPETPPLEAEAGQKRPIIPSRPSTLQQVLDSAPELVESANLLLARASQLFDDRNLTNLAQTLENVNSISASLAGRGDEVGQLIADAAGTMENLRGATGSLNELAAALKKDSARLTARAEATLASVEGLVEAAEGSFQDTSGEVAAFLEDLRNAAESFEAMSQEVHSLVAENREPIHSFTVGGLYELTTLITEARGLLVGLNRVTTEVERDPARFLFGNQQQGYEAGQPQ